MSYDQTDQDQLYIEDGYFTPDGYYVYIAEARVDLTPYIDEGYIDFNYYEFYGGFATLTAELTEVVGQLKEAEAQLSSTVSISVSAQRTRNADSAVDCAFTQTATVTRIQQGDLAVSAQVTQTTQAVKTVSADINAGALFSPSITVEAVKNMTAVIDCVTTISADTVATRVFNITLSSIVTQSLQGVYTADAQSSIASAFSSTANTDVVKEYSSNQSSEFTQTVSIDKLKRAESSISVAASLSAQALNLGDRPLQLETAGTTNFDTAQKKFGTHSLQQTGATPISYYAGYDQLPQTSDFYISGWYRPDTGAIAGSSTRYIAYILEALRIDLLGNDTIRLAIIDTNSTLQVVGTSTAVSANTQYHIAVSRSGQGLALWLNGSRAAYVNNFFDTYSFYSGAQSVYVRFAQSTGHYDEWEMSKGTYGIYNPANTTYTVPTTETANNETNTRFLFHWDNSYADDISKQGAATLSAQASQTSVITKTVGASANLTSAVTQTATATKAVQAQINLNAAFSQNVSAEDIDLAEIALSAEFTLQAQVDDLDLAAASLTSEFTFTVSTDKLKGAVIDVGAMFTPVIDCVATRVGDIDLTASAAVTANIAKTAVSSVNISANTSVIANVVRAKPLSAQFNTNSTLYATRLKILGERPRDLNFVNTASGRNGLSAIVYDPNRANLDPAFTDAANYSDVELIDFWFKYTNAVDDQTWTIALLTHGDTEPNYANPYYAPESWSIVLRHGPTTPFTNSDIELRWQGNSASERKLNQLTPGAVVPNLWHRLRLVIDNSANRNVVAYLGTENSALAQIDSFTLGNRFANVTSEKLWLGHQHNGSALQPIVYMDQIVLSNNSTETLTNNVSTDPWRLTQQDNVLVNYNFDLVNPTFDDLGVFRVANANITSIVTQTTNGNYLYGSGPVNTQATVTVSAQLSLTKQFSSNQNSAFTLNATVNRVRTGSTSISAQSTINAEPYDFTKADSNLSSTATLNAEPYDFTKADSNLSSTATLNADITKFRFAQANLSTTATLAIAYTRIRPADIQTDSIATQLTAAFKNATGTVLLESSFAQQTDAVKTTEILAQPNAVSSISAQAQTTVFAEANISAIATQTVQATKFRPAQANLSSNFTINISAVKTTNVTSNNSAEFTQSTANDRLRDFNTTLNAETAQNTQGLRVKIFTVNVNTSANILATAFALVKFEAGLTSNGFVVTVGDVEHIDPYYTYMIEQETRAFQIDEEPRLYTIDPESRVNIIKGSLL